MDAVTTQTSPTRAEPGTVATKVQSSDYETFLKMLTVQMRNQDPLNPVEASDFAAQLASFSSVEQQVLTNDLLRSIEGRLANSDFAALADWVGMDVRSAGAAHFNGEPITTKVQPDPTADRNEWVVRDSNGREIYRSLLDADANEITWAGETLSGASAASGLYTLSLERFVAGKTLDPIRLETYGRVQEARIESDGVTLTLAGGQVISVEEVTALRAPL
jgi:flagellar basal-body rod modification protein FlgD